MFGMKPVMYALFFFSQTTLDIPVMGNVIPWLLKPPSHPSSIIHFFSSMFNVFIPKSMCVFRASICKVEKFK